MIPGISEIILDLHMISNRQWNIASSDVVEVLGVGGVCCMMFVFFHVIVVWVCVGSVVVWFVDRGEWEHASVVCDCCVGTVSDFGFDVGEGSGGGFGAVVLRGGVGIGFGLGKE